MLSLLTLLAMAAPIEKEVVFTGVRGVELKGTLSVPADLRGPATAVLLLPGSGPTDRNGDQLPTLKIELLKQISDRLVAEGFVTLRFDKRAVAHYAPLWPKEVAEIDEYFSWDKFVGDAKAAMAFLRKQEGVDPKSVVVAGHSEGAAISVAIGKEFAGKPEQPKALVLLAGPGRTLDHLLKEQVGANLVVSGLPPEEVKKYTDYLNAAIEQIKKDGTILPGAPAGLQGLFQPTVSKLLKAYFTIDPSEGIKEFPGPVLLIQAKGDAQVSWERDTPRLVAALKTRAKDLHEAIYIEGSGHGMKEGSGFDGKVAPKVLDELSRWLKALPK